MRHVFRLMLLQAACNLVGIADGLIYSWLGILPGLTAGDQRVLLAWSVGATALSFTVVPVVLFLALAPIGRGLDALAGGQAVPDRSRLRALTAPILMSRVSTWAWFGSAATLVPVAPFLDAPDPATLLLHVALVTLLTGSVASTFVFYAGEAYTRARIVPRLVPDGAVSRIPGVSAPSVAFKIIVLLLTTSVLPISILTVAAISRTSTPWTVAFLGGSLLFLGALQVVAICASITLPLVRLAAETEKVRDDDLTARASVVSADVIGKLGESFNGMVEGLKRGRFVKETFGRYVSRQVVEQILGGKVELGGETRLATVLFSDVRGFTALAERLPPNEVVRFLNRYLDLMVDVLVEHEGTIDKFIGDGILVSFGVPVSRGDDAMRAVRAGLAMLERLRTWNAERAAAGEAEVQIGIGIHTGEVVAGNIGSAKKMEYTVIGDTVNTSSRIEQLNKRLGTRLLVSEETWLRVKDAVRARPLDPVEVSGKSQPLLVYEVTGLADGGPKAA